MNAPPFNFEGIRTKLEKIRISIYGLFSPTVWIVLGIILCVAVVVSAFQYDYPAAGIAFGGAAFFASWLSGALYNERKRTKIRNSRPLHPGRVVRIEEAQIASDLAPLVGKLSLENSKLQIVGYDGQYILGRNKRLWRKSLSKWLKEGLDVEYILMNPPGEVIEYFKKIKKQEGGVRLKLFAFERSGASGMTEWEKFKTFHPTLFYGGDGTKAMWIEENHPLGSGFAYDVTYVPPDAMNEEQNGKFDKYERMIDSSKSHCREVAA